jgi:geranylgeranyl reductase family protein
MSIYDVIIVGAGPAGTTFARSLAKQGVATLILEKGRLPRDKPCAGGVTIRAANLLDFDISSTIERTVYGGVLTYKFANKVERHSDKPPVYMTSRDKFDALLAAEAVRAGAKLIEGSPVIAIEKVKDSFRIETANGEYLSRILVGADGANGTTAASLGLTAGFTRGVAIECEVYPDSTIDIGDKLKIDLGTIPAGYGWCFPKSDHLSIGAAGYLPHAKKLRTYVDRLIDYYCPGGIVRFQKGAILRIRDSRQTPIISGGAILLGEAAGLVNAFTGEGIYYAIKSGLLAVPEVLKYLRDDVKNFDGYQIAIDSEMMPELGLSRTMAGMALHGTIGNSRLFFDSFATNQRLWRHLAAVLSGEETYSEFKKKHRALKPLLAMLGG